MGTLAPIRGDGSRGHVQSAPAGKPPAAAKGAPGDRRRGGAANLPVPRGRGRPPPAPARPQRPPPAPRGPPVGGGPGHCCAPRRPRGGTAPTPVQPRPRPSSGTVHRRPPEPRGAPSGSGRTGEARRRDPPGGGPQTAPARPGQGRGAPLNGRPGAPPRPARSPRGRSVPAARPAANPGVARPPPPQLSQRTGIPVPGRGGAQRGAHAGPPPRLSAADGRDRRWAKAKDGAPPHHRPLAAKRAPGAGSGLQSGRSTARGSALDRHGRTAPGTKREPQRLPRTLPPQPRITGPGSGCAPKAAAGASRCAGGAPTSRQPAVETGQKPKTPAPNQNRRQLLEQWVISRGRNYKRPPMSVPAKKPRKAQKPLEQPSLGGQEEEVETEKREQRQLADQIATMLAECCQLAEEGFPSEELLPMLSRIPEAEKFAQFWICKAKLLARPGTCDVVKLYEAAVCAGAAPIKELRDVIVDILQQAAQATPAKAGLFPDVGQTEPRSAQKIPQRPTYKPVSSVKLQVLPLLRAGPGVKILTPVRRSLRIEHALARYPLMLQDHDPVVSSLAELLATEKDGQFVFRPNEALPEEGAEALLEL